MAFEAEKQDVSGSESIVLSSSASMQVSLEAIRDGKAGLDTHRQSMLNRIPHQGDWARFELNTVELRDLAYLSAKTGDEFALLRGKKEDILFHGTTGRCQFTGALADLLKGHKLSLVGHSHPGEPVPKPSIEDRQALKNIGQARSAVISGMTGKILDFGPDRFEL